MAADGSISAPADPSRWRDAREWFLTRRPVLRESASDTERDARLRAFRVAGITSVNLITEVHQAIDDALRDGTTLDEFKKRVSAKLAEEWGAPNARRVETIFRTNVQSAYNAGRFAEMTRPAVLAVRPFWKFVAILDGRTTATCAPLNGVIRPHDDRFWESHFPPLHFNCRSTVVSLSRSEAERAGGAKEPPKAKAPGAGFGTRPDLAGTAVEPTAQASAEVRKAHADRGRSRREDGRGDGEPAKGPVPTSEELKAAALRAAGLEEFERAHPLKRFEVLDFSTTHEEGIDREAAGQYFEVASELFVSSSRTADAIGQPASTAYSISARGATLAEAMERTAVHELAHHVRQFIGAELRTRMVALYQAATEYGFTITPYAAEHEEEYFAECFAAYVYHPDELRDRDPDGYDLIEAVLQKIW